MGRKGTGTIHHRPDGSWQGGLQVNKRRVWVYGRTRAEVEAKLNQLRLADAGSQPSPLHSLVSLPEPHTLGELIDRWLEIQGADLKPRTLSDYRKMAAIIKKHLGAETLVTSLKPELIQAMYSRLRHAHQQAAYVHCVFRQMLKLAVMWDWLTNNPLDRVIAPRYRPERQEVWSQEQLVSFLQNAGKWRPLWIVLAACGLRIGEARALRWQDVDLQAGTLRVTSSLQHIDGKYIETSPKTASSRRLIHLPPIIINVLQSWKLSQQEELAKRGTTNSEGWIWTRTGQPASYYSLHESFSGSRCFNE